MVSYLIDKLSDSDDRLLSVNDRHREHTSGAMSPPRSVRDIHNLGNRAGSDDHLTNLGHKIIFNLSALLLIIIGYFVKILNIFLVPMIISESLTKLLISRY